jgi:hypothetical protein
MSFKRRTFMVAGSATLVAATSVRPAFADPQTIDLTLPTTIPFKIFRDRVHLVAAINGEDFNFFFDAGGPSLLTPAAVDKLGLTSSGERANRTIRVAELRLGAATWRDQSFPVAPLPLESPDARMFGGIIGREYFVPLPLTIDYEKNFVTLIPKRLFRPPTGQAAVFVRTVNARLLMDVVLDGIPIAAAVQTAIPFPLTISDTFSQTHALPDMYPAKLRASVPFNGQLTPGYAARARVLQMGGHRIDDLLFVMAGPAPVPPRANPPDALLGLGLFRRFTITFDLAHGRAFLARNSHYADPSPYNRTGMTVAIVDGQVQITDIVPLSGAAEAGAAIGDRIKAFNGLVLSATTNDAIAALFVGPVGSVLTVRIERAGAERDLAIRLRDLI